jgi:hypothetical protein
VQSVLTGDRDPAFAASHAPVRSAAFALVAVPVTLAGHVAAGGRTPDEASLLIALVLTAAGHRLLLSRRERSGAVLAAALAVAQAGLHVLFGGAGHAVPDSAMAGMAGMAATSSAATSSVATSSVATSSAAHAAQISHGPTAIVMIAGHGLAAIVIGWFLRAGEQVLWAAARRAVRSAGTAVHRLVPGVLAVMLLGEPVRPTVAVGARTVPVDRHSSPRRRLRAVGGRLWRGPPSVVVLC